MIGTKRRNSVAGGLARRLTGIALLVALVVSAWKLPSLMPGVPAFLPAKSPAVETVMFIGGSVALGHFDETGAGYLGRAFKQLGKQTSTVYQFYNKSINGANSTQLATMYRGEYNQWLTQLKPHVVVISWGLINDALPQTSKTDFDLYLRREIDDALATHAVVLVVTPPVTAVAETTFKAAMQTYMQDEIDLVHQMNNPNVRVFNLYSQMENYLKSHHLSYVQYEGDAHHPNTAGHILAGKLLYHDMYNHFRGKPIQYQQ